jgi:hypothetical protein
MTGRSLFLGALGVIFICGFSYFNDQVMRQTFLIGNNMPFAVYGLLIVFVMTLNPLLRRVNAAWALSRGELAVILLVTFAACNIPGSGLMRVFPNTMVLPHQFAKTEPGWVQQKVMDLVPKNMLVDVSKNENEVLNGFIQGLRTGTKPIKFSQVPFEAWGRALALWIPILLALWLCLIGIALVVHKQWSGHEQLPYPLASVTRTLMEGGEGGPGSVFRSRLFWIGTAFVFLLHLNNYMGEWFPKYVVKFPTTLDFWALAWKFQLLWQGGGWFLGGPHIYFSVIGISFFLASEVSLSIGIAPILNAFIAGVLLTYGINIKTVIPGQLADVQGFMNFGACLGIFLVLLYTGRHYYLATLKKAFLIPTRIATEPYSVWGMRMAILSFAGLVVLLSMAGLDWQLSLLYAGIVVILYLVMGRIIAETGVFYISQGFHAPMIIVGLFGAKAIGPETALIMALMMMVLTLDPREALMPFAVNSLGLAGMTKVPLGRTALPMIGAILLGFMVAIPVQLYLQYDRGYSRQDSWAEQIVKTPFNNAVAMKQRLSAQGTLERSMATHGWKRFSLVSVDKRVFAGMAAGLFLVLLFSFLRLNLPRWPLHPLIFVLWTTWPTIVFFFSFLIGWLVKATTMRFGGVSVYQRLKPLMIGLIAGEILAALAISVFGWAYFAATGHAPKPFFIFWN